MYQEKVFFQKYSLVFIRFLKKSSLALIFELYSYVWFHLW